MPNSTVGPESSAARVALWRALHLLADPTPHILEDDIGLKLLAPERAWRSRPDMHLERTKLFRASILARARFVEDLVEREAAHSLDQYVILGAGLDSFVQRRPELASGMAVFEVDQSAPQAWKRRRLLELGYGVPDHLKLVGVDFETTDDWRKALERAGFDAARHAVVAALGLSMYLTRAAIASTLRQAASLAAGSVLVMSFLVPLELASPEVRPGLEMSAKGARANGTPFISFFTPDQMVLARDAGFKDVRHVPSGELAELYFAGRSDGLRPPATAEELLVACT